MPIAQETIEKINRLLADPVYAAQPDDDPKNLWVTHQEALKGNISRFDAMGLQLLSLIDDGTIATPLPEKTRLFMQQFLENSVGNVKLNSFLRQSAIKSMDFRNYGIPPRTISLICNFSFKTRNFGQGENVLKLIKLYDSYISGSPVTSDKDKLSLKELSIALDLTDIYMFESRNSVFMDLINGSIKLKNIYNSSIKAKEILTHMQKENNPDVKKLGSGVLVLKDTRKVTDLESRNVNFRGYMRMNLITRYQHAAMLDFSESKERLSHLTTSGFDRGQLNFSDQLTYDMYKIDPIALIPKEHHQLLEQLYETNWKLAVASKFKVIENELYINGYDNFRGQIAGVNELENASAMASFIPFGHKKLKPNDFEELHQDVMTRGKYNKKSGMLCSSFCAISIATSLVELDKQIKKDIISSKLEQDAKKINTLNIVTIPFGKHEDLYKIHPERLLVILKSYNCVEAIQLQTVGRYIKKADARPAIAAKKRIADAPPKEKAVDRLAQRKPTIQSRL